MLETIHVDTIGRSYPIHIQTGLLEKWLPEMTDLLKGRRWTLVTDEHVSKIYAEFLEVISGDLLSIITVPSGERRRQWHRQCTVLELLAEAGMNRNDGILAFGGGVVGDLAGFCASIYMRGISWVQIPTTLLSQVDSSVGGKTGVNLKTGKNLAGSFHQPLAVWIDPLLLKTLPRQEIWSGCAEVVKYGILEGECLREWLRNNWQSVTNLEPDVMTHLIYRCLQYKAAVVTADEKEMELRKILNFGHTAGHAIEKLTHYQFTHGQALRTGMLVELDIACRLHRVSRKKCNELKRFVTLIPEAEQIPDFPPEQLVEAMTLDKKNRDHRISFILPREPRGVDEVLLSPSEVLRLL
jgi:3-dehydroquinate synthase